MSKEKKRISFNITFDGVFFELMFDGGGLILSILFTFVKTKVKVFFVCIVEYGNIS